MFMISVLKRLLRLDSYTVYCETESKPIIMVNGLRRALYFAYRHRLRTHEVYVVGDNGVKIPVEGLKWDYRCAKCGLKFDDDAAWVSHMTKADHVNASSSMSPPLSTNKDAKPPNQM
jgi:hypothetical protein